MNNLGLHKACTSCTQRIIEGILHHNVVVTISNIKDTDLHDKCSIEDGLLGGKCGNNVSYYLSINEVEKE